MPRQKNIEKMSISERDQVLQKLQHKLGELNGMKIQKAKELKERKKENVLLEKVTKKYNTHITLLRRIKETQIEQIQELLGYLDKAVKESEITESKAEEIHKEHKRLMKEMEKINKELSEFDIELSEY